MKGWVRPQKAKDIYQGKRLYNKTKNQLIEYKNEDVEDLYDIVIEYYENDNVKIISLKNSQWKGVINKLMNKKVSFLKQFDVDHNNNIIEYAKIIKAPPLKNESNEFNYWKERFYDLTSKIRRFPKGKPVYDINDNVVDWKPK